MQGDALKVTDEDARVEALDFDERIKKRLPPRPFDVMEQYYWPLTTFGERGDPSFRCNNRYHLYKRHLDHLMSFKGKRVLNVACGTGELSLFLAHCGCDVVAFDFSPKSVEYAREMARINGFADKIQIDVMDIRNITYPENSFDVVTGEAALHHVIKYDNCFENMYRVLKPGGVALFFENFVFDPMVRLMRPINWYFKGYVGEYSLGREDIEYAKRVFDEVRITDHAVFYTYARFFYTPSKLNRFVARTLKQVDNAVLPTLPFLKRFYSLAYMELHKK
jgi:ubiquinone/menaquinone biosynthesis C-methylase UbiE